MTDEESKPIEKAEDMFRVLTPDEEKQFRQWARDNYEPHMDVKTIWHPIVQAECAQIKAEYPAMLAVARNEALANGYDVRAVDAVIKAFPTQAVKIFKEWRHDTLNGCYYFNRWGMYVGVEYDGYIHT